MPFADGPPVGTQPGAAMMAMDRILSPLIKLCLSAVRLIRRSPLAFTAASKRKATASVQEELLPIICQLETLNHTTEEDFLELGGELAVLIGSVHDVRSRLEAVTELMSGESADRMARALSQASIQSSVSLSSSEGKTDRVSGIRRRLAPLKRGLAGFEVTIATFRSIAVLTRIETSRLAEADSEFYALANDMTLLAASLEARVESSLAMADSLTAPIEKALEELASLESDQASNLPAVIEEVSAHLSCFQNKLESARGISSTLGARYNAIGSSFSHVIVALQSHDITRQQVEHVIQVLRSLISDADSSATAPDAAPTKLFARVNNRQAHASILALQSFQLERAGDTFAASIAAILLSMDEIARHIRDLSGECKALLELSEDEGSDLSQGMLSQGMEEQYVTVLAGLQKCAQVSSAITRTESLLQTAVSTMRKPLLEIQTFELQILRLSMNASICAARAGSAGDCLAELAGAVQTLALDSQQRSASLLETLSSAVASETSASESHALPDHHPSEATNTTAAGWMDELRGGVADLQSSSRKSRDALASIVASGNRISGDFEAACQGFRVGPVFADSLHQTRTALARNSSRLADTSTPPAPDIAAKALSSLKTFYTMQSERDVHETYLRNNFASLAAAPVDEAIEISADADDGVLFF